MGILSNSGITNTPFVSQYVGNNLEEIKLTQKKLEDLYYKAQDTDTAAVATAKTVLNTVDPKDRPAAEALFNEIDAKVKDRVARGDYERMVYQTSRDAANLAANVKPLVENKARVDTWLDNLRKNEGIGDNYKGTLIDRTMDAYEGKQYDPEKGIITGPDFRGQSFAKDYNVTEGMNRLLAGIKENAKPNSDADFVLVPDGEGSHRPGIREKNGQIVTVGEERVEDIARRYFAGNSDYQNYINREVDSEVFRRRQAGVKNIDPVQIKAELEAKELEQAIEGAKKKYAFEQTSANINLQSTGSNKKEEPVFGSTGLRDVGLSQGGVEGGDLERMVSGRTVMSDLAQGAGIDPLNSIKQELDLTGITGNLTPGQIAAKRQQEEADRKRIDVETSKVPLWQRASVKEKIEAEIAARNRTDWSLAAKPTTIAELSKTNKALELVAKQHPKTANESELEYAARLNPIYQDFAKKTGTNLVQEVPMDVHKMPEYDEALLGKVTGTDKNGRVTNRQGGLYNQHPVIVLDGSGKEYANGLEAKSENSITDDEIYNARPSGFNTNYKLNTSGIIMRSGEKTFILGNQDKKEMIYNQFLHDAEVGVDQLQGVTPEYDDRSKLNLKLQKENWDNKKIRPNVSHAVPNHTMAFRNAKGESTLVPTVAQTEVVPHYNKDGTLQGITTEVYYLDPLTRTIVGPVPYADFKKRHIDASPYMNQQNTKGYNEQGQPKQP